MNDRFHMRIFISYSRKDRLLCDAVVHVLQAIGDVEVDRDTSQPMPGAPLSDRLKKQISSCDLFVVLLTEDGITSPWVTTEVAWATSIGKHVIPVLQLGRTLSEVPSLRSDLEYIEYDPSHYEPTLEALGNFVENVLEERMVIRKAEGEAIYRKEKMGMMERLNSEDVLNLLLLQLPDVAPDLEKRLIQNAKSTVSEFFKDPRYAALINLGTLATDAKVVTIRRQTLHALLRAAQKGNPIIFRREGYEAGILYGIGVIKWFLEKSATQRGRKGLPRDPFVVLDACTRIDDASGWGEIKVTKDRSPFVPAIQGWDGVVSVGGDFLAHEMIETRSKASVGRYAMYRSFWQGYLEGAFSTALGTWYGMWEAEGEETVPLFAAQCEERGDHQEGDLVFGLSIHPPVYNVTYMSLQRELFCPYLRGENARVASRARGVLEGFVRELAGAEASEDVKGIVRALTWLGQNVDNIAKGAAAYLQETRNFLHKSIHDVSVEPPDEVTRRILRLTTSAVLMACRDIRLDDKMKQELKSVLLQENAG